MKFLNNKTVIITGASSGIGLEVATILIKKYNCKVIATGRSLEKLNRAKQNLGENYITFSFDVGKEDDWKAFAEFIIIQNLQPNIIINNAGIMLPFKKTQTCNNNDFFFVFNTNFLSVWYSTKYILPILCGDKGLVNISSSASLCPVIGQSLYCSSKSAVKSFTEVLQTECDFYVGFIMPGLCKTDIFRSVNLSNKDKTLIDKFSLSSTKCANKIVKAINKKQKRKVIGIDAKFMKFLYFLFPKSAGKIIAYFLRKSKLEVFNDIQK